MRRPCLFSFCFFELGFLPKGAASITQTSSLANQSIRRAVQSGSLAGGGEAGFLCSVVCGFSVADGVRVGPAFSAGPTRCEESVGELGTCAMVSEGPLSPEGGLGRRLSLGSRGDRRSLGLGRG